MAANYRITIDLDLDRNVVQDQHDARVLTDHLCSIVYKYVEPVQDVTVYRVEKLD